MTKTKKTLEELGPLGWAPIAGPESMNRLGGFKVLRGQPIISPEDRKKTMAIDTSGLPKFNIKNMNEAASPQQSIAATGNPPNGVNAVGLISAEEQAANAKYLADPNTFQKNVEEDNKGALDTAKDFLGNLFDSKDAEKEVFGESVFDAGLNAFGWMYDTINQAGSWAQSAAPGGLETFDWDTSGEISVGQAAATANARLTNEYGPLGAIYSAITNPLGLGGTTGALTGAEFAKKDFDIKDVEARRKAFEEDAYGKYASGIPDTIFTLFADPLIFGGKLLKVARIKYVDRQVVSKDQLDNIVKEIDTDVINLNTQKAPESSLGEFLSWVMRKDPVTGKRVTTSAQIYEHPVIKNSSARDSLAYAFSAADDVDEAAAILKYTYGDVQARDFLMNRRADIATAVSTANRDLIEARLRFNPKEAAKVIDKAQERSKKAYDDYLTADREFQAGNITDKGYVDDLFKRFNDAETNLNDVTSFRTRNPAIKPSTADEVRIARESRDKLIARDRFLKKAIDEEKASSLANLNKGFAAPTAFGRAVERSRQSRAMASEQARTTPAAPWKYTDFYEAGLPNRVTRLWRYAAFERESGYVQTRGAGNIQQGREIRAVLDGLKIYKGAGVQKTVNGQVVTIGGVARRDELFNRYLATVGTGVDAENSVAKVIDSLEKAIAYDIGMYRGLTKAEAKGLLEKARQTRTESLTQIQKDKFWIEEVNGKVIQHKAPYIESQLMQGTYMLNFREIDKAVTMFLREQSPASRLVQQRQNASAMTWNHAQNFYNNFNDLWRPAVLLRLGYTQRNVTEGLFRSSAYLSSVAPLGYAGKQLGFNVRNVAVARAHAREMARLEKAATATGTGVAQVAIGGSKRFQAWRTKQEELIGQFVGEQRAFVSSLQNDIAVNKLVGPEIDEAIKDIAFVAKQADEAEARLMLLSTDDDAAFAYFSKQGAAKRRVWDGVSDVDGVAHRQAFSNPEYADIAWMNLSADNTTKTTLSLRNNAANNVYKAIKMQHYKTVNPSDGDAYFEGVSQMLRQFKNSEVGEKIIAGENPAEIARWLTTDSVGKEIGRFVNGRVAVGRNAKKSKSPGFDTTGLDGALGYVNTLVSRLESLAPNPALRDALRLSNVSGADVKRLLDIPAYRDQLMPAIGNVAEEVGFKGIRESLNAAAGKMFKVLGTIPEDNMVRGPFYGRIYRDYVATTVNVIKAQSPSGFISARELDSIHRMAHRRALQETKSWLYTIDRRTNLGAYGEVLFPFISATQNSATALGKLAWRDPALPGMIAAVWNMPAKMNIEDEEGNIVFPIQLGFIPKSVRDTLGIDAILNAKVAKTGLNVIFPETGAFGFVPRMGPIGAIPVSEIMKNEWFGASIDTPSWLTNFAGDDVGKEIWDNWKTWVYGEDRGASPEPLSWNVIAPPAATKLIQIWQGMGSSAYAGTYNKIMQTERLRALGGERDGFPTPEELTDKTNKFFILRFLGNLAAFTPPQYEMVIDPLVDVRRSYDRLYKEDGDRNFHEQFGPILSMTSEVSSTKNVAGAMPTMDAVTRSKKYSSLIEGLAPDVQQNLGVLGIVINGDLNAEYDPSALTWQSTHKIPGLNRTYRELQTSAQVQVEASRTAGWVEFIKFMDQQQAILEQRGLNSFQSRGAEDLAQNKKNFIDAAQSNPLFSGWYDDYISFGSTRVVDAVKTLERALGNKEFMADHSENPVWTAAYQYVTVRPQVIAAIDAATTSEERKAIKEEWAAFRTSLINSNNKWGTLANRYLDGDEDPTAPSTSMFSMAPVYDQAVAPEPNAAVDESGFLKPTEFFGGQ